MNFRKLCAVLSIVLKYIKSAKIKKLSYQFFLRSNYAAWLNYFGK